MTVMPMYVLHVVLQSKYNNQEKTAHSLKEGVTKVLES